MEIVKLTNGDLVEKEVISHTIIYPDGTKEERMGMPGDDLEAASDDEA